MSLDRAHASFDGHSLEELFVIEDVRRPVLGSASATTQAVGLADGGVFLATRYEVPEIKVSLAQAWRDPRDARDALRRLAAWLHVDSPRPLEFGDESSAYYMALPSGALDASRVGVSAERIEVTFAVPDALLRSGITRSVTSADGLAEFEVGGYGVGEFVQNGGKLVTQGFVDLGITLYHYFPAQEASCDVVLLCQAGEPHSGLDLFIFLRGHPEGHGLVPPAIFVVSVFQ